MINLAAKSLRQQSAIHLEYIVASNRRSLHKFARICPTTLFCPLNTCVRCNLNKQHQQFRGYAQNRNEKKEVAQIAWFTYGCKLYRDKEINTIPNILTMSRIVASPGLSLAIAYDMKLVALGGCVVFGFTDWLDGYIAKNYNQQTRFGAFLDPLADKILICALSVGLAAKGLLPLSLLGVWLGRDVALITASFTKRALDRPEGSHFFDTTSSATFVIKPSELSKVSSDCAGVR